MNPRSSHSLKYLSQYCLENKFAIILTFSFQRLHFNVHTCTCTLNTFEILDTFVYFFYFIYLNVKDNNPLGTQKTVSLDFDEQ